MADTLTPAPWRRLVRRTAGPSRLRLYRLLPVVALVVVLAACTPADSEAEFAAGFAALWLLIFALIQAAPPGNRYACIDFICTNY